MGARGPTAKGAVLRGYRDAMEAHGVLDAAYEVLPVDVRKRLDDPPIATESLDARYLMEVQAAIGRVAGQAMVREVALTMVRRSLSTIVGPLITGALRVYGARPSTLLERMDTLVGRMADGYEFEALAEDEAVYRMRVRNRGPRPRREEAEHWAAIFTYACEVAGYQGEVEVVGLDTEDGRGVSTYRVRWHKPPSRSGLEPARPR